MRKVKELNKNLEALSSLSYAEDPVACYKFLGENRKLLDSLKPFRDIQREMQDLESVRHIINALTDPKNEDKPDPHYLNGTLERCKEKVKVSVDRINAILINL